MKAWMAFLLIVGIALAAIPLAAAHTCSGTDCGPCVKGETHQHADGAGKACDSGVSHVNDAGYGTKSYETPAGGAMLATLGALAAALVVLRRR